MGANRASGSQKTQSENRVAEASVGARRPERSKNPRPSKNEREKGQVKKTDRDQSVKPPFRVDIYFNFSPVSPSVGSIPLGAGITLSKQFREFKGYPISWLVGGDHIGWTNNPLSMRQTRAHGGISASRPWAQNILITQSGQTDAIILGGLSSLSDQIENTSNMGSFISGCLQTTGHLNDKFGIFARLCATQNLMGPNTGTEISFAFGASTRITSPSRRLLGQAKHKDSVAKKNEDESQPVAKNKASKKKKPNPKKKRRASSPQVSNKAQRQITQLEQNIIAASTKIETIVRPFREREDPKNPEQAFKEIKAIVDEIFKEVAKLSDSEIGNVYGDYYFQIEMLKLVNAFIKDDDLRRKNQTAIDEISWPLD